MPLTVTRRRSRGGALTITGTVAGQRIRRRAQSNDLILAREEAATLEASLLRSVWHGERRGVRSFAEAALSYLEASPRSENHKARINRLLRAMGDIPLSAANQEKAVELKHKMLRPEAAPGTYIRAIVMPIRAILLHAHSLGWCDAPHFVAPRENQGRTRYLLPGELKRLVTAAAPHLRPLLTFLVGTGARMSEAMELDWKDVDLNGARAIFWRTKGGKRRNAYLPPVVVTALANLLHREGSVFRRPDGQSYTDRGRRYGGQIRTAWAGALRRAELDPGLSPHDLRHTWASWHYGLNRDLLALKVEGCWSSVALVERYAHLLPSGHENEIRAFLGHQAGTSADAQAANA